MEDYVYDAFLSYSHVDREWASLLEQELKKRNFKIFLDSTRLTGGGDWNKELQVSIRSSRHLLVLWSNYTEKSQWVTQEMTHFEIDKEDSPTRRQIHVDLEGQSVVYQKYHAIDDLKTAGVYAAGFGAFQQNSQLWKDFLEKLERALDKDARIPVHKAVLASTLDRLQTIPLNKQIAFMPTYEKTLENMGIKKDASDAWKAELATRYGANRYQWKPFGGVSNIDVILENLAKKIQVIASAPRFRWENLDDRFWTVNEEGGDDPTTREVVRAEVAKLLGDLVLIVIDPISLYDEVVFNRLNIVRNGLKNNPTATSVLAPFKIPQPTEDLRRLIESGVTDLYEQYYEPVFAEDSRVAALEVCALQDQDLKRLLGATLRFRRPKQETSAKLVTRQD